MVQMVRSGSVECRLCADDHDVIDDGYDEDPAGRTNFVCSMGHSVRQHGDPLLGQSISPEGACNALYRPSVEYQSIQSSLSRGSLTMSSFISIRIIP